MKTLSLICLALLLGMPAFAQQNPVPLINQPLSPTSTPSGGSNFTLTVNGSGFVSGSVVNWNGSSLPTGFVSSSRVTAAVSAAQIASTGTAPITVVNPAPGGGPSNRVYFQITAPTPGVGIVKGNLWTTPYYSVTAGDFNHDGSVDAAFTMVDGAAVAVALGNGNGTFQPTAQYDTGTSSFGLFSADLNGDGNLDLVAGTYQGSTVAVLLGNGDGTFKAPVQVSVGTFMECVAFADLNRDGKLDMLVTTSATTGQVSVLLGNGDGTFQSPVAYVTGGSEPKGLDVGDFNHDGFVDVAVGNYDPDSKTFPVSVLLGNGDGTLQPRVDYAAGTNPVSIVAADLNGDGNLDLAATDQGTDNGTGGNTIAVLFGNSDGTFQPVVLHTVDQAPTHIKAGDLNGDGKLDLVFTEASEVIGFTTYPEFGVLLGNGDGTFSPHINMVTGNLFANNFAVADFNNDGKLDLLAAQSISPGGLLFQQGQVELSAGTFHFSSQINGVQSGQTQKFSLSNGSSSPLTISSITITGANPADFPQTNNCQSVLPGRGSCTISVTFLPEMLGNRNATVTISDNAHGTPQAIRVFGTSVTTIADLFPSNVQYNKVKVGMTAGPVIVTLTNVSSRTLTINRIGLTGPDPGDYAQTNNCGASLAPGATCTFQVTFTPTQIGLRLANLSVSDDGGGSPQRVMLQGTGD